MLPFAAIALDAVPDRLFDYAVPTALDRAVQPGVRVRIPFGRSQTTGYVIERLEKPRYTPREKTPEAVTQTSLDLPGDETAPEKSSGCRPIQAVEDPLPFFSPLLISLLRWLSAYYCAPFAAALRCALPAPIRSGRTSTKEERIVTPLTPKNPEKSLTPRQKVLYGNILRVDGGRLNALCKEFKTTPETLRRLEKAGYLTIECRAVRRNPMARRTLIPTAPLPLMPEQTEALRIVRMAAAESEAGKIPSPVLLFGVTGSGKTEVYLQAIGDCLKKDESAIMLVPEIALTPQTVQRFAARFGDKVAVLHSALSDGERFDEWHRIRNGEARVVVGPRSAVFAPVQNLGLIVVDEEHEPSYKQDETPRYNARDVAVMRAYLQKCPCILGSATPALETWHNVQTGKYTLATLSKRVENRPLPHVHIVDMRLETGPEGQMRLFSQPLADAIRQRLEHGEQTILFLNRRGYAPTTQCPSCGYAVTCASCSIKMTYHRSGNCLRCHLCGAWQPVPAVCPQCASPQFNHHGFGTQRIEQSLAKLFPPARIIRMDADSTTRRFSHDDLLSTFRSGRADILIGTQMIAKGLDFPNVTLVGIIAADMSLHQPDFRAAERTFQLLAQVSGRAGRGHRPGEVYIQTHMPDHIAVQAARHADYPAFAAHDLAERKEGDYPPYSHLACLTFRGPEVSEVSGAAAQWESALNAHTTDLDISPALPSPLEKWRDDYRYQILLRAPTSRLIINALNRLRPALQLPKNVFLAIDIDALSLM